MVSFNTQPIDHSLLSNNHSVIEIPSVVTVRQSVNHLIVRPIRRNDSEDSLTEQVTCISVIACSVGLIFLVPGIFVYFCPELNPLSRPCHPESKQIGQAIIMTSVITIGISLFYLFKRIWQLNRVLN